MPGTRCFDLTRYDGTKTDFSYFKCSRGSKDRKTEILGVVIPLFYRLDR